MLYSVVTLGKIDKLLLFSLLGAIALQYHDSGTRVVWLDNVACIGREARLIDCYANPLGSHDCADRNDAGVLCSLINCPLGDLRLIGDNSTYGRVEICINNVWRSICAHLWTDIHARVACRQLGLPSSCT